MIQDSESFETVAEVGAYIEVQKRNLRLRER